jgi:hypothetical protein
LLFLAGHFLHGIRAASAWRCFSTPAKPASARGSHMSIMSFPDRGPWGSSKWRGNCSGHVYKELFERIKPAVFVDPMMGSGTSIDVAKEMGIEAYGLDLHQGFNILTDSILKHVGKHADLVISHPPYGGMIKYSGQVWGNAPVKGDLSRCADDEEFLSLMTQALLNQRCATTAGGVYGTIIGDYRNQGRYASYQAELIARLPKSELSAVLIKAQHNTMSGRKAYGKMKFPFIEHEYVILWTRPDRVSTAVGLVDALVGQNEDRAAGTWKAILRHVMAVMGGEVPLKKIYDSVSTYAPARVSKNPNWQAKIRQTLQLHSDFRRIDEGIWALA